MYYSKIKNVVKKNQYQLTTMPGFGFKMAAMLISSIKNIDKFDLASKLACYGGLAPVEHSSGTSKRLNLKNAAFYHGNF